MYYSSPLIAGRLIKRYKRFLADVELADGRSITVHTANTGKMTGCAIPGTKVWIRDSQNPKRKYPHSWELASSEQGELIGINTQLANLLVSEAIENGTITELGGYDRIDREVSYGELIDGKKRSRIDLLLSDSLNQKPDCYVEVKNVTALVDDSTGIFPDAVSKRGTKHLRELLYMHRQGYRSVLVFCVARADIQSVRAAYEVDKEYAETLQEVRAQGVEVYAYGPTISTKPRKESIWLSHSLSVL